MKFRHHKGWKYHFLIVEKFIHFTADMESSDSDRRSGREERKREEEENRRKRARKLLRGIQFWSS